MSTERLMRAITFATVKHDGQKRKVNKEPFIGHPYRVAMLLKEHDCNQDLVIAGLLHDVVEDTDGTLDEIDALFGQNVTQLVSTVTEKEKSLPWDTRKQQSIDQIRQAPIDVKLIACADKIDNLGSMLDNEMVYGDAMWHAFERGKKDQQWYYQNMFDSVTAGINRNQFHPLMDQFEFLLRQFLDQK
ncbi:MAG TPA: bifunctional (p)ppGpp synthetase/guanosine-3',5'-bis(diphosphate) 3'-pyrophosphohydrolase [Bacilli bacterium]|nr:bifunctional (p)ppGpp synthetase/guanosine-3',5'-bis(diphosphate) 3'-pyrophosphohydrolase [Bacilli bacterium]